MESIFKNITQYSKNYVQNQDNHNRQESKGIPTKDTFLQNQIQCGYLQAKFAKEYKRL